MEPPQLALHHHLNGSHEVRNHADGHRQGRLAFADGIGPRLDGGLFPGRLDEIGAQPLFRLLHAIRGFHDAFEAGRRFRGEKAEPVQRLHADFRMRTQSPMRQCILNGFRVQRQNDDFGEFRRTKELVGDELRVPRKRQEHHRGTS